MENVQAPGDTPEIPIDPQPEPSIGRIVRYNLKQGIQVPAIVTRVHSSDMVNLRVFYDSPPLDNEEFRSSIPKGTASGTWSWPPRAS